MADEEDTTKRYSLIVCKGYGKNGRPCGLNVTDKEERCSKCNTPIPGRTDTSVSRNRTSQGFEYQGQYDEYTGLRTLKKYDMYKCTVTLPREECRSTSYNYYIEFDKTDMKEFWNTTSYDTRFLDIRLAEVVEATINCYDGIVIFEKQNLKRMKNDAELSLVVYLQAIPEQYAETLATTIKELTTSLRKVYWETFHDKTSEIDEMYKKVILSYYLNNLQGSSSFNCLNFQTY
ncbi:unnamed protein product [Mytilus edulis]|uniref:Uncharacterized protein n=1 Tax=Mytilus edulis TaxID=6550 RepID=A0A8S3QKP7_MYTED|nr:unnamed protein product [Mytilus edulis]